uniref:Uncharacterized protein n=1 Tax=Anguilla anguilla TaxID=7936 RepID=A0A0E9S863_ANGAN
MEMFIYGISLNTVDTEAERNNCPALYR